MQNSDAPLSRLSECVTGARDTIPMLIGAAPFGVIFGTLVTVSPVSLWQGQLMSLAVYAGSSQFIGLGLISAQASFLVVWATTLIVNLRHVLYAATLLPHLRRLPTRWRLLLGLLLTDEVFAVSHASQRRQPGRTFGHWHMLGSGVAMYLNWQFCYSAASFLGYSRSASISRWSLPSSRSLCRSSPTCVRWQPRLPQDRWPSRGMTGRTS